MKSPSTSTLDGMGFGELSCSPYDPSTGGGSFLAPALGIYITPPGLIEKITPHKFDFLTLLVNPPIE